MKETITGVNLKGALKAGAIMKDAEILMLPLNKIKLAKNSRLIIKNEDLSSLMQSIKQVGLLQPIGVSKKGKSFSICYGNRRYLACSRLGMKKIPVVLHKHQSEAEEDLKNLTENIQRRQISLVEAGRYISLLVKAGLNKNEIAARLGVNRGYVGITLDAYAKVPKKFQDDIEVGLTKTKGGSVAKGKGKIAISAATKIIAAKTTHSLTKKQVEYLFEAAKNDDKYLAEHTSRYAMALKAGKKDPVGSSRKLKRVQMHMLVTEKEYGRLHDKYVLEGPFRGIGGLFGAIVSGKVRETVKAIGNQ